MIRQVSLTLSARQKGFHLITDSVLEKLGDLPAAGLLTLFIQHTSAGLTINENADPTVRQDLNSALDRLAPEDAEYLHDDEGPDDMPAHVKSVLTGSSITIPILNHKLALGRWQGITLCEFRAQATPRTIIATIVF